MTHQASHLWKLYLKERIPIQSHNSFEKKSSGLTEIQSTISPQFQEIFDHSEVKSVWNQRNKEDAHRQMSEIEFRSKTSNGKQSVWTSSSNKLRLPMVERNQYSELVLRTPNGQKICQSRLSTVVPSILICFLCSVLVALPIGLLFGLPRNKTDAPSINPPSYSIATNTLLTSISVTTTTKSTSTPLSTASQSTTATTTSITAWIPSNYNTTCSNTCMNVSTVTPATLIASWPFEQNAIDASGNGYDGQIINGTLFMTGYIGQAIQLQNSLAQYVTAPYINLVNRSFTIEAWIYLYSLAPSRDLDIVGECEAMLTDKCLHFVLRYNKLYAAMYNDDLPATTILATHVWHHVAFVYDSTTNVKYAYINGTLDAMKTTGSYYRGLTGNVLIGSSGIATSTSYWNGLLDQVKISNRAKTACEILNDATLVVYFPFDNNYIDMGPNSLHTVYSPLTNGNLTWVSGQVNQALNFDGTASYFVSCGYWALGQNQPYSLAMWINPTVLNGTIFHLSSSTTGSGNWCLPLIGFSSTGSVVVQMWNGTAVSIVGPIFPTNTWFHIVQTWSVTNGLRLYLNGGLYSSEIVSLSTSSSVTMCITLGNSGLGTNTCQSGQISMGSFAGAIDELYIYSRELTASEICPLAHP